MPGNNIGLIRLMLAWLVLVSHSYSLTGSTGAEPAMRLTGGQLTLGDIAVAAFFALSGALIVQSWMRGRGWRDFIEKRIRRIYPGFLVAFAVSLVVGIAVSPWPYEALTHLPVLEMASRAALLQVPRVSQAFAQNPYPNALNGSLWTIRYEFVCYLLVALVGLVGGWRWRPLGPIFATAAWASYLWSSAIVPGRLWPRLFCFFAAGTAWACYPQRFSARTLIVAGLLLVASVPLHLLAATLPVFGVVLLFGLGWQTRPLACWPVNGGRDFSYGVYLYAFLVQQTIVWLVPAIGPFALMMLASLAVVPCAVASWYLIERPTLRRVRS